VPADRRSMTRTKTLLAALILLVAVALPGVADARGRHGGKNHAHHAKKKRDRNHDGLPDRWERRHRLSLKVNQARRDQDGDGLGNRGEFGNGTDPRDPDTDGDGVGDGNEVGEGTDPADSEDCHEHGDRDEHGDQGDDEGDDSAGEDGDDPGAGGGDDSVDEPGDDGADEPGDEPGDDAGDEEPGDDAGSGGSDFDDRV
jgi:hypothetical protein